jgi:hypothetical protein
LIDLREVVLAPGAAPLSATIRAGEVIRIDGPHASALCEVLAGRRAPLAGRVIRRGAGTPILVHADDRLPGEAADALRLFATLAGTVPDETRIADAAAHGEQARAIARASLVRTALWIVDGPLEREAEQVVQVAAEEIRAGGGAMVWTAASDPRRERVDRTITTAGGSPGALRPAVPPPGRAAGGIAAFVAATAASRGALGFAALAALALALCAWTVGAHEGFWFAPGSAAAADVVAPIAVASIAILAAVLTAVRAGAAPTWPAMLRDSGASAVRRWAAVVAGDVAAALPSVAIAALAAVRLAPVVLLAALAAALIARAVRHGALGVVAGAIAGAAVPAILLW